jgi:hypothetical protein
MMLRCTSEEPAKIVSAQHSFLFSTEQRHIAHEVFVEPGLDLVPHGLFIGRVGKVDERLRCVR